MNEIDGGEPPRPERRPGLDWLPRGFGSLTASKVVLTTAQRWVPALLPTLTVAFGTTTNSMTSMMAIGQLGGSLTMLSGRWLNERTERRFIQLGILIVLVSSAVALGGSVAFFGLSFILLVIGHTHATVASHAWIGHRVPFSQRARAVGFFEVSWSLGLLIGTPLVTLAVTRSGWQWGYVALIVGCAAAFVLTTTRLPIDDDATPGAAVQDRDSIRSLPSRAWVPIFASALAAAAGIGFFAVASSWLADSFGFTTSALGLIAFGYGAVELVAASSVAVVGDRLGTRTSMLWGLGALLIVIVVLASFGSEATIVVIGLLAFLMMFEFAFVSSLALVTEAAPHQRGTAIGASNGIGTIGRAIGVAASGLLYDTIGIGGALAIAAVTTSAAMALVVLDRRLDHATVTS